MSSYLEASARERLALFDAFEEFIGPAQRVVSPHLAQLNAPVSFDDGVVVGRARLDGFTVFAAAQEGGFMGGAVGEVHGAKLVGMLRRAVAEKPDAVVLLLETGGVRLHEANAGLIAVSEVMRAVLDARAAGIPVIVLIGGSNGAFGGMGIVARCANTLVISEEGRLAMSGPEVIETANGVEEFDSRDRALVWRTTGGKHRYLMGDVQRIVDDSIAAFRAAAIEAIQAFIPGAAAAGYAASATEARSVVDAAGHGDDASPESGVGNQVALTLEALEAEQAMLAQRIDRFGSLPDPLDIWAAMGVRNPPEIPMLDVQAFIAAANPHRQGA